MSDLPASDLRVDPQPLPPEEPDPAECCGEGCVPCVYDRHDQAVQKYRAALILWRERHPEVSDRAPISE